MIIITGSFVVHSCSITLCEFKCSNLKGGQGTKSNFTVILTMRKSQSACKCNTVHKTLTSDIGVLVQCVCVRGLSM